ncbi:MAG: SMC-Scp complex subunit ScpB [Nanoarchaeota archaeon]|nr:SMC-Scp complex subunit ScpB [Nanoarchaeota archaeon]
MLKNKLEALLFSSGRKMNIEELSRLVHARHEEIQDSLSELKKEYDEKNSSIMIINEGDSWKLTVREQFLSLVQKIVTETEISKTVTETLAVIAFKYPIKQSDLIKIRTNKAYDNLKELEGMGYITRQKHGRTYLIKLTQKFFEYFDLPEEKLKEHFNDFASIAKAIENKEQEIDAIKQKQKEDAEKESKKDEEIKKEVESLDDENKEEVKPAEENPKFEREGIKLTKEEEKIVDEKVEKILHPQEEEKGEEPKEFENKEKESEEEPKDLLEAEMEEKEKDKK